MQPGYPEPLVNIAGILLSQPGKVSCDTLKYDSSARLVWSIDRSGIEPWYIFDRTIGLSSQKYVNACYLLLRYYVVAVYAVGAQHGSQVLTE